MKIQVTFTSKDDLAHTSLGQIVLMKKEQVLKAEIYPALYLVDRNQSFKSANGDSECFEKMFPYSNIAKSYSQEETKGKYTIQFGIAPHISELLLNDLSNMPFIFKFDETTTQQTKKQYDGYITYFSTTFNKMVTQYCGSLFVGHCTSDDLVYIPFF